MYPSNPYEMNYDHFKTLHEILQFTNQGLQFTIHYDLNKRKPKWPKRIWEQWFFDVPMGMEKWTFLWSGVTQIKIF